MLPEHKPNGLQSLKLYFLSLNLYIETDSNLCLLLTKSNVNLLLNIKEMVVNDPVAKTRQGEKRTSR